MVSKMRYDFMDAAWDLLRQIPNFRELSFLELSCGDGCLLERLANEGASVRGTTYHDRERDYIRSRDYPAGVQVDGGIDLNKPLPFEDASFDVVYSTEVVEHLEGHRNFVTQSARVVKPNGWFLMTTPNIHRLVSRIHFAVSGVHLVKSPIPQSTDPLDRMEEFHHRCADFTILHWLLWNNGLRIEKVIAAHVHPMSRALGIAGPLLKRFVKRALQRHFPKDAPLDDARRDLIHWMTSGVLLTSENICLLARKTARPFPTAGVSTAPQGASARLP